MRNVFIVIAGVLVVIAALAPLVDWRFLIPDWIPRHAAVAVAYVSAFACVGAILFIVLVGLLALIAFQLQEQRRAAAGEGHRDHADGAGHDRRSSARAWCSPSLRPRARSPGRGPWSRRSMRRKNGTDTTGHGR